MYRHTLGDDVTNAILIALIIYLILAAPLGLPGGELVVAIRSTIEGMLR